MMITEHLAAGFLVGGVFDKSKSKIISIVSVISSVMADLPVLFLGGPGEIDYLSHRIYTHTIILSPIYSIIPIILVFTIFRRKLEVSFLFLYLVSFISYSIHILIDLLNPFGVQLFYPFSNKIFSLDLFHAFDPIAIFFSLIVIGVYINLWFKRKPINKKYLIIFSFFIGVYTLVTISAKIYFENKYQSTMYKTKGTVNYLTTVPRTFWRWKSIAKKDNYYITVYEEDDNILVKSFLFKPLNNNDIKNSSEYIKFNLYARYPIINFNKNVYNFFNLVYSPKSYNLTLKTGMNKSIEFSKMTGFDIYDKH